MEWVEDIGVVAKRSLPPDPDVLEAIGLNHDMTSALADLVDNCVDAKATDILIRFVRVEGHLRSMLICDDGSGMNDATLDEAMTVGRRREYSGTDLGHFGMGLKSASFSQADLLSVLSSTRQDLPSGRRWQRGSGKFECDVLDSVQVEDQLKQVEEFAGTQVSTMIRWDQVRTFPATDDPHIVTDYLSRTIQRIRFHLGLVLHRLLATGAIRIQLDLLDADSGEVGPPQFVEPIDLLATAARVIPTTRRLSSVGSEISNYLWLPTSGHLVASHLPIGSTAGLSSGRDCTSTVTADCSRAATGSR